MRLGGNPTGALTIYRRLQRSYPDSTESHLSFLVAGRMWLDRDRPDLAAPQFGRYLETGGGASEEALVGRAMALGRMGRGRDEAADWRRLLSEHPRSVYANRARARLNEGAGSTRTSRSVASPR
jgi:Tetratricopeptide repeat